MELLGPLQTALMRIMWKLESSRVARIHELMQLSYDNRVMYTSVLTTLNTLNRKGLLHKEKAGRKENIFHVAVSQADYQVALVKALCIDHFNADAGEMGAFLEGMAATGQERAWTVVPLREQSHWKTLLEKSQEPSSDALIGGLMDVLDRMIGSLTVSDADFRVLKSWSEDCCGDQVPMICTTSNFKADKNAGKRADDRADDRADKKPTPSLLQL